MKATLTFLVLLLFFASGANAQIVIAGKVVNKTARAPVSYASVYINNTTIGTTTDGEGKFLIKTNFQGQITLVISHTAFTKKVISLSPNQDMSQLSIELEPQTNVLNEVIIAGGSNSGWKKWRSLFTDYFLGTSGFAKKCTIKNPEVLTFRYNKADNELKVTSNKTLIVENRALGYLYRIDLNKFSYSFATLQIESDLTVLFENLKPLNAEEQKQFTENRSLAYNGSKMDFIRSIYKKEPDKNGFIATAVHLKPNAEKQRVKQMISDALAQAYLKNENINSVTLASITGGNRDLVLLYEQILAGADFVVKDTSSISLKDNVTIYGNRTGVLHLKDTLLIQYSESQDSKIRGADIVKPGYQLNLADARFGGRRNSGHLLQCTLMMLTSANQITIYPDGGYDGALFTNGYMDNKKVSGLLPWDYIRTGDSGAGAMEQTVDDIAAPDSTVAKNIVAGLKEFFVAHATEKAYLQTDRPYYSAGDTVYFKAYLTNSETRRPSGLSKVLHVDLINGYGHIDQTINLQVNDGVSWGDFLLPDTIKNGNYRIRARTRLMGNNAEQGYYEKGLTVIPVKFARVPESGVSRGAGGANNNYNNNKIDLQFFPEGGDLVTGVLSKVAFKAVGPNGLGLNVKGVITDNDGKEVCTFASQHLGMGYFYLSPGKNKTYKAELIFDNNLKESIDLPKPVDKGLVLDVNNERADKAIITISASEAFSADNNNRNFTVIVYSGGKIVPFVFRLDRPSVFFEIDKSILRSGVARATLFSPTGEPLAERLFFVKGNDLLKLQISANKAAYSKREPVKINLAAQNKGLPANGHFSVSVIDDNQSPDDGDAGHNILTDMLLTSDIKGFVEQPNYYFTSDSEEARNNLDLLMLSQGYRRFQWKEALDETLNQTPAFQPETSFAIEGFMKTPDGKPVAAGKVVLMDNRDNLLLDTITDASGSFKFYDLNVRDSTDVLLSARKNNGNTNVRLSITQPAGPPVQIGYPNIATAALPEQAAALAQQKYHLLAQGKLTSPPETIHLKAVNIKANRPSERVNITNSANLNGPGHSNFILMGDQLFNCNDVSCFFGKFPGTTSRNGVLYLISTGDRPVPITFILDGIVLDSQNCLFNAISASDIYSIELLASGSYKAIYGSEAGGGALIVTTKRGGETTTGPNAVSPGLLKFQMNGFYKARQFYSPVYVHKQSTVRQDMRSTIYWNPELTTDKDGNLSFNFYNNDDHGSCRVIVEGIDNQGSIGRVVYRYKSE